MHNQLFITGSDLQAKNGILVRATLRRPLWYLMYRFIERTQLAKNCINDICQRIIGCIAIQWIERYKTKGSIPKNLVWQTDSVIAELTQPRCTCLQTFWGGFDQICVFILNFYRNNWNCIGIIEIRIGTRKPFTAIIGILPLHLIRII